ILLAQPKRRLKIGHTGITWGFRPDDAAKAIPDVARLGYHGYESFGNVIESWEEKAGLAAILESGKLALRSAYCPANLTDAAALKTEVATMVRWGKLIKKLG